MHFKTDAFEFHGAMGVFSPFSATGSRGERGPPFRSAADNAESACVIWFGYHGSTNRLM